ncbi:MAG: hypothetical protein ACK5ME_10395 [Parahaliea sp.]
MKVAVKIGMIILAVSTGAVANDKEVSITSKAGFYDAAIIPDKIKNECTNLGANFSKSTKKYLEKAGWQVSLGENVETQTAGTSVKLEIMNAMSSGNAYIGHHKSVAISATLYRNGKEVDAYTATRDSGGGFFGGFKGSCAVLYRCVNTLGSDVTKWLGKK